MRHRVRLLAEHIKEFKPPTILTPVFMILEVIVEMWIPMLMASIIDRGIEGGDRGALFSFGGLMLALAVAGLVTGVLAGMFSAKASTGFARNLREAMFNNIQTFSFSNIDKYSTPGLVTRLTTDVTNIQMAFQMLIRMFSRAPVSLIVAMVMAFSISAKISSIYLVAIIVLALVLVFIAKKAMKYFREIFPKYDKLNESIDENVTAIRVVKSYVREEYETKKEQRAAGNIYKLFVKAEGLLVGVMPIMMSTVYVCILLISWLGAKIIVSTHATELTTGELTSLLTYCMNILMSLMMTAMVFVMVTMSEASARRICEVLEEKSDLTNPENPDFNVPDGSIEFKDVRFSYKVGTGKPVLDEISLQIASGETVGIIGSTGSAKTSLINLLSRLYDVNAGTVCVGGKDVRTYDLTTLRDQVAVVLQKNVLFSGTVLENLRWGDENATLEECRAACRMACADEFIEQLPGGYDAHVEQGGSNLSGGQRQRLCIARALLKKPKVLILDDSTSAVDTATDARIRKAFREDIPNTTKLIIAQRVSSVHHADRIIVMNDGRVDAFDTPENLLKTNKIYQEVYESQMQGGADFDEGGD